MKKKSIAVAVTAACITLSATLGGCSLVTKNNTADLAQEIATVDIRKSEKFAASGLKNYEGAIAESSVLKRDLLTAFLNVGASYMNGNSDMSYADVFNMLVNSLVNNEILTQYAIMYCLEDKSTNTESILGYESDALSKFNAYGDDLQGKYEYLLGGENNDNNQIKLAKYRWYSSLNSAIDNYEETADEEEGYKGNETRTTPVNLDTEQDDYFPKDGDGNLDYNVYTGYKGYLLADSGAYKDDAKEGTNADSRKKAYNRFLNYLRRNDFITEKESQNLTDIKSLEYIKNQYVSQLESSIVNIFYDIYEEKQAAELSKNGYAYINDIYRGLVDGQEDVYTTASAFESAMSSMSSTSFILNSPKTKDSDKIVDVDGTEYQPRYGFVYNILLPFDSRQSVKLAELNSIKTLDEDEDYYYAERNKLLRDIRTEDQRGAWFNGQTDYSFKASESGITEYYGKSADRGYLFFENNLTQSGDGERYKKLQAYYGRYSYNGSVYENEDGSYTLLGEKLSIDGMLKEFSEYINYACGSSITKFDNNYNPAEGNNKYYETTNFHKTGEDEKDEIDYSKFLYASGKVDFGTFNNSDLMNPESTQYKAMSAVNELQFAYTTDTGVLSNYVGYNVSAYDTSYIKEFEYAAKLAVSKGAGNFAVCAGDYGWHLVYVTYSFGGDGEVYSPNWAENVDKEGTFENLFFEWIKGNSISDITTNLRDKLISDYNRESGDNAPVTKYQSRYQNLLDLSND